MPFSKSHSHTFLRKLKCKRGTASLPFRFLTLPNWNVAKIENAWTFLRIPVVASW